MIEKIPNNFNFLFEQGFSLATDEDNLDNGFFILVFNDLSLRITKDRADWFIDIGFSFMVGNWYELWDILKLLKKQNLLQYDYNPTNKVTGLCSILKACIEDILKIEQYKGQLSDYPVLRT